ncbi:WXG100 family type VII secretion target [Streptomyces sp. NBC_01304]|uniref:WXG100 family type VII secretion target n=1 Tax=Streptomyces sp. NBC_01304 TaxID=2903818 RepID=UPI002E0DBF98|nr:WXG100 family type VII secretion target [Streptomyces sp. NBC_01304]
MAGSQKVTDEVLQKFELELNQKFGSIKHQLTQLDTLIDSVQAKWQGEGAVAFDSTQRKVNAAMAEIGKMLIRFEDAVASNRRIAGSTDQAVFQALQGVDVGSAGASGSGGGGKSSAFGSM